MDAASAGDVDNNVCKECDALRSQFTANAQGGGVWTRRVVLGLVGFTAAAVTSLCAPFLSPALRRLCLPFVPATPAQVDNVAALLRRHVKPVTGRGPAAAGAARSNMDVVDLGSGDGRIVIACGQRGYHSVGVELNYWLILYSRLRAYRLRHSISGSATFYRNDIWKINLEAYRSIIIFGTEQVMQDLGRKLRRAGDGCGGSEHCQYVVACRYPLPPPWVVWDTLGRGLDTTWIYQIPHLHPHRYQHLHPDTSSTP